MATTRAKFRCDWVRDHGDNKLVHLSVVYSRKEGTENRDFTKATPNGFVEMQIDNPAAAVIFKPGRYYYCDFTECSEQGPGYQPENLNPAS